jgi:hypothetical protein
MKGFNFGGLESYSVIDHDTLQQFTASAIQGAANVATPPS